MRHTNFIKVFAFGFMASTCLNQSLAETGHSNSAAVQSTEEAPCPTGRLMFIHVSEDGQRLEVRDNNTEELIATLTVAELAGIKKGMGFRVLPATKECASPADRSLIDLINEKVGLLREGKDPNADFLVYVDKSDVRYYEFDKKNRSYEEAVKFCEEKGLRIMTNTEAIFLHDEIRESAAKADLSRLKEWLRGEERVLVWAAPPELNPEVKKELTNPDYATGVLAYEEEPPVGSMRPRFIMTYGIAPIPDNKIPVRCVTQARFRE